MILKLSDKKVQIEESSLIVLFVCLFSKSAREYLSNYYICFLFITFHELSHIFVASLFGGKLKQINIKISGLNINLDRKIKGVKGVLVYLAGPISNIILALLFYKIRIVFEINMAFAILNLLPLKPLDGYNILNELINKKILKIITNIAETMLLILGIVAIVKFCNISLIILLIYIKLEKLNSAK